jgi:hypothetical protein
MALQMEDALSIDVAELDRFDRVERVLARTKAVLCIFRGKSASDSEMKSATDSDLNSAIPI